MADEHDEPTYELVLPYVVCKSEGGPLDDHAFVLGRAYGTLDVYLANPEVDFHQTYVHPDLLPQLDLLAMRHGYFLTHEPWADHPDEWSLATFTRTTHPSELKERP